MTPRATEELRELLKKDRTLPHRRYPDQALFALSDERVSQALDRRLEQGATLTQIGSLEYDFFTGFNRLVFKFSPSKGIGVRADALLVFMDGGCRVAAIVDPFDPDHPNPAVPALPERAADPLALRSTRGELPFVLSRPSAAGRLHFTEEQLFPIQVRSREFFQKLAPRGTLEVGRGAADTNSPWSTLRSLIIIAFPENIDEPVADVDESNDDI